MAKFDVGTFLELAQKHRVTHTMLVPVQYRRIMAHPDFDTYDLSAFRAKFCTSAPFADELKADILTRCPGNLLDFHGRSEERRAGKDCVSTGRSRGSPDTEKK